MYKHKIEYSNLNGRELMKILFLCGFFEEKAEKEVIENAKKTVQFSSNIFQKKLINGFSKYGSDFEVLSAPFIGSYPNESKIRNFNGFSLECSYDYVPFNNIWGLRNFSRSASLKKRVKKFINYKDEKKIIVVYSVHTPFLETAVYAKKKDPRIKIILICPDLPEYMNLNSYISLVYKLGKKYDIHRFNNLNKYVDSYMLLTEEMKNRLNVGDKPYVVVEGLVDKGDFIEKDKLNSSVSNLQYIVYTGKMNEKFGIKELIDAFMMLENKNYRLILCGSGDCNDYIQKSANIDSRIQILGQIPPKKSRHWQFKADVLVNPRPNGEEFVKYSFPSKNIEYLMTGNPVVAFLLDGMPKEYKNFMFCIDDNNDRTEMIFKALTNALNSSNDEKYSNFIKYVRKKLNVSCVIDQIIDTVR